MLKNVVDPPENPVRSPHWSVSPESVMSRAYGRSCLPQRTTVRESWRAVREAIPAGVSDLRHPYQIAHLGSAPDGSLQSIERLLRTVMARNPGWAVEVTHVDRRGTDFRPLWHQLTAAGDLDGRQCDGRLFHRVVGGSFWNPLFPRGSVDMAVCHMAAHWLSRTCPIRVACPESGFMSGRSNRGDTEINAEVAHDDWSHFWHARALEMVAGGTAWVTMLGREVGTSSADHLPLQLLKGAAREAALQGWVSASAAASFSLPVYRRTLDEALSPFQESPLSECFHVESAAYRESACPLVSRWCKHRDDARFAREVARFIRGFSESVVTRQLFGDRLRVEQRPAVARFFALVEQQVRELNRPLLLFRRGVITLVARRSGLAVPDSL